MQERMINNRVGGSLGQGCPVWYPEIGGGAGEGAGARVEGAAAGRSQRGHAAAHQTGGQVGRGHAADAAPGHSADVVVRLVGGQRLVQLGTGLARRHWKALEEDTKRQEMQSESILLT